MNSYHPMRLRLGVAMAVKGGRTAIVGSEVFEKRNLDGRTVYSFEIGSIDRIPGTVEGTRDRVIDYITKLAEFKPCVMTDIGSPQGEALLRAMRDGWPKDIHRPHAYEGVGDRKPLFSAFLHAYSNGRVVIPKKLKHRAELDKSLVFFMGSGHAKEGLELESEDEAMVVALGLSLVWPIHGQQQARKFEG